MAWRGVMAKKNNQLISSMSIMAYQRNGANNVSQRNGGVMKMKISMA